VKLRVLLVTGDEGLKERLLDILRKKGYKAACVDSCEKALEHLFEYDSDLIIFDPDVKELEGTDVLPVIKKIQSNTPVIVVSDNSTHEADVKVAKAGVYFRLGKAFDDQIINQLLTIVEKNQQG